MPDQEQGNRFTEEGIMISNGICLRDPQKTTETALSLYTDYMTASYIKGRETGNWLYNTFCSDFGDWETETFLRASKISMRDLRNALWDKGVYTPRDKQPAAIHLYNLIQSDFPEWPANIPNPEPPASIPTTFPHTPHSTTPGSLSQGPSNIAISVSDGQVPNQRPTQGPAIIASAGNVPNLPAPQLPQLPPAPISIKNLRISNSLANYENQTNSRELATLSKIYNEQEKYTGRNDVFDYKFELFLLNCERAGIPKEGLHKAFTSMLKEDALTFYLVNRSSFSSMSLMSLCDAFRANFEGKEHAINLRQEWNGISLQHYINNNQGKNLTECLDKMLERLRMLQHGLEQGPAADDFLFSKLITACETIPDLQIATMKPSETTAGLINDLRASASRHDRLHPPTITPPEEVMFTDRRYYNQRGRRDNGSAPTREQRSRSEHGYLKYQTNKSTKKCRICHKPGCWSTNHSPEEQRKLYRQYLSEQESYRQYLIEAEGEQEHEDENTSDDNNPEQSETFLTAIGSVNGRAVYEQLTNQATLHTISRQIPAPVLAQIPGQEAESLSSAPTSMPAPLRYGKHRFYGIMIDTGAANTSSAGFNQFLALKQEQDVAIDATKANTARFKFGVGEAISMGTVGIATPIGLIVFHIVDTDTPFLLSLRDLDATGYYLNNQTNYLVGESKNIPVIRLHGHPFLVWGISLSGACSEVYLNDDDSNESSLTGQLTEQELRQLHRRFGHPSASRLVRLLRRAGRVFNYQTISHLTKICSQCQKHGQKPGRFRFTIRDNDLHFNHSVIVDVMYVDSPAKPVLHVVDEATRFQTARFLVDMSAGHIWDTLRSCWIDTYVGPPDMIVHDAGKQFKSSEFSAKASGMAIETKAVPVEAHHSIGIVERYHVPLRRAYDIIREDSSSINKVLALQMAVKAVNDTAGPDGLTPTLLVFGAFPRMSYSDPPHPSIAERSRAIRKAMREVSNLYIKRQVTDALRQRNGPDISEVLGAPIGSKVLVWREEGGWQGPYQLLSINDRTCDIQLPHGPTPFRISSVKPYFEIDNDGIDKEVKQSNEQVDNVSSQNTPDADQSIDRPRRQRKLPVRYCLPIQYAHHITTKEQANLDLSLKLRKEGVIRSPSEPFEESRRKEINGLITEGVFRIVSKQSLPSGVRIFGCRFVDEIKYKGDAPYEKSRLVVQAHHDQDKKAILTQSPTIQRVSQRLIICFAAILPRILCIRDISQAYVQSKSELTRQFFVKPPKGTDLGDNMLQVIRPLYGIPEAGNHWFKTYHDHHINNLGLTISTFDPCLMFSKEAIVGLQTDDSIFSATSVYITKEEEQRAKAGFLAKPVTRLEESKELVFNGATISSADSVLQLTQERQCHKISLVEVNSDDLRTPYVRERARGAYIASMSQPETSFALSRAAQTTTPTKDDAIYLNKCLAWQKANPTRGLRFIKVAPEGLKLLIFVDAAFANNKDLSSQIGYIILLANEERIKDDFIAIKGNIIHWSSIKCKRVTRSVLASELYAMVAGFDISSAIQATVNGLMQGKIPIVICTDSYSLYDCMTRLGTTAEKRLMIDIMGLRQSYERREIDEIRWIDGACNPADAMTKDNACSALKQLVDTNYLELKTNAWVERSGNDVESNKEKQ